MESYLELKQYKWIIMLMAQFRYKICWQAVFLDDHCSCITAALTQVLRAYVGLYVHIIRRCQMFCPEAIWFYVCRVFFSDPTFFASHTSKQGFWVNWLWTFGSCDVCISFCLCVFFEPDGYKLFNVSIFISSLHVNVVHGTPALTSLPSQDSVTVFVLPEIKTTSLPVSI